MSFEWLNKFHKEMAKPADYAEKTLAQYRMGMKARGSIVGVVVVIDEACPACRLLDSDVVYHPDNAPRLPLAGCKDGCRSVYRPVMSYQVDEDA